MVHIHPITPANATLFREIRLRALQDSPAAFASTYAREAAFDDAEWARRVQVWNGDQGIGFLAIDEGVPCGIAGALLETPAQAQLVSMWIAPDYRQRGVGRSLVESVVAWADLRGLHLITLMVTSVNESALRFYERLGFTRTGRTEPYPNDPALFEWEMARSLN
jgi:ribosomal protein S18 acetylase RimI-like enzyme